VCESAKKGVPRDQETVVSSPLHTNRTQCLRVSLLFILRKGIWFLSRPTLQSQTISEQISSLTRKINPIGINLLNAAISKCLTFVAPTHPAPLAVVMRYTGVTSHSILTKGKTMTNVYRTVLYQEVLNLKVIQYVQQPETSS